MMTNETVVINGDGSTSRDFSFIKNIVQANLLAATSKTISGSNIYNVAVGENTSLNELYKLLKNLLEEFGTPVESFKVYADFRAGDILHSHADISKAGYELGYVPQYNIEEGLRETIPWYLNNVV